MNKYHVRFFNEKDELIDVESVRASNPQEAKKKAKKDFQEAHGRKKYKDVQVIKAHTEGTTMTQAEIIAALQENGHTDLAEAVFKALAAGTQDTATAAPAKKQYEVEVAFVDKSGRQIGSTKVKGADWTTIRKRAMSAFGKKLASESTYAGFYVAERPIVESPSGRKIVLP